MASEAVINGDLAEGQHELHRQADLIRRAKARSPEAWTEIYETLHPKLFRYVQARVSDQHTAEDLTATAFLEALKSIDSYVSRGRPLLAWLYTIARNVVNYHYRSQFRGKPERDSASPPTRAVSRLFGLNGLRHDQREVLSNHAAGQDDPASAVERWDLRDAIDRLSDDQRDVIILRYFVGLTTPEVAKVVGKNERAVYSLQTRAIKALRRHLH